VLDNSLLILEVKNESSISLKALGSYENKQKKHWNIEKKKKNNEQGMELRCKKMRMKFYFLNS